jgi:TolA-binding protein
MPTVQSQEQNVLVSERTGQHDPRQFMLINQLTRIKDLVQKIRTLEDKLVNTSFMSLKDQQQIHEDIKRIKAEIDLLEKRTRQRT